MTYTINKKYPVMNEGFKSYSFHHLLEVKDDTLIINPTQFDGKAATTTTYKKEIQKELLMPNTTIAIHRINAEKALCGQKLSVRDLRLAKKHFGHLFPETDNA